MNEMDAIYNFKIKCYILVMAGDIKGYSHTSVPQLIMGKGPEAPARTAPILLEVKTNEVAKAIISAVDYSQSKTEVRDYHVTIKRVPASGAEKQAKVSSTYSKTAKHGAKSTNPAVLPAPQTIREQAHNELKEATNKLTKAIDNRNNQSNMHFDILSKRTGILNYIREVDSYAKAVEFVQPIARQLKPALHAVKELKDTIDSMKYQLATKLSKNVQQGLLTKDDAIKTYSKTLDSVYTEELVSGSKIKQTLLLLTACIGNRNPNLSEQELQELKLMKAITTSDEDIVEELQEIPAKKKQDLSEFTKTLS